MTEYFSKIPEIKFEGEESTNPFAFKFYDESKKVLGKSMNCLLYTSPSPRDYGTSRMPSSA